MENVDKKNKFAPGICFYKLFLLFVIGSFLGTIYEQFLTLFRNHVWESRRGMLYLPLNQVYGFGLSLSVYFLGQKQRKWYQTILYGAFLGGSVEYFMSFIQEKFIGTYSWDYSNKLLNIDGRTTIIFALFWGVLALLCVKLIYPPASRIIEKIPPKSGKIICNILVVFISFDLALTGVVLLRQGQRLNNIPANNFIDRFLDSHFDDDFIKKAFPNMMIKQKGVK